ncbi:unnamed protein product [Nesidiocoris tenuis]|uniref:Uncharacterized protein n=1 Tax=Nesidiocoris tenuis TaxID=355587 RepID=A0A6H5G2M5_9HEMI|nr:unnamed protein product [Nesidiocoris tenuis]
MVTLPRRLNQPVKKEMEKRQHRSIAMGRGLPAGLCQQLLQYTNTNITEAPRLLWIARLRGPLSYSNGFRELFTSSSYKTVDRTLDHRSHFII